MQITYVLEGRGWSQLILNEGRNSVTITGSYLTDCAGDLARATTRLLGGSPTQEVLFEGEPQLTLLRLERCPNMQVRVEVFLGIGPNGDDLDSARQSRPAFTHQGPLLSFVSQIGDALQRLLDEHGPRGYQKKWGFAFPGDQLSAIRARVGVGSSAT